MVSPVVILRLSLKPFGIEVIAIWRWGKTPTTLPYRYLEFRVLRNLCREVSILWVSSSAVGKEPCRSALSSPGKSKRSVSKARRSGMEGIFGMMCVDCMVKEDWSGRSEVGRKRSRVVLGLRVHSRG